MSDYSKSRVEHYKMNCMGQNEGHVEGADSRPMNPVHLHQEQSHLMALTSEWGHSVFEPLHGSRENTGYTYIKPPAPFHYKTPTLHGGHNLGGMIHNPAATSYVSHVYGHKQDPQVTYNIPQPQHQVADIKRELREEEEKKFGSGYITLKNETLPDEGGSSQETKSQESDLQKNRPYDISKVSKAAEIEEEQAKPESPDSRPPTPDVSIRRIPSPNSLPEPIPVKTKSVLPPKSYLLKNFKNSKYTEEEIIAKRAALAAAQRAVRQRRKEKMSAEEWQKQLDAYAAAQREKRKVKISKMNEEELKLFRAREASRQKELRNRKRSAMSEEELKAVKAREAALSAARRARRLGLVRKSKYAENNTELITESTTSHYHGNASDSSSSVKDSPSHYHGQTQNTSLIKESTSHYHGQQTHSASSLSIVKEDTTSHYRSQGHDQSSLMSQNKLSSFQNPDSSALIKENRMSHYYGHEHDPSPS